MNSDFDSKQPARATTSAREASEAAAQDPRGATSLAPPVMQVVFAIVLVAAFGELGYTVVNVSAMPVYVKANGLPIRWVAIVTTAFLVVEGLLKSPFGVLGDHMGRKKLIFAGPCVSVITALLTPQVHNGPLLVVLRVLDGIGAAALWPAAFSMIGDYVPERRRASAMSYFNIAYLIGIAIGPLIGGAANQVAYRHLHIANHHLRLVASKDASFYLAAVLFLLTSIVALVSLPGGQPPAKAAAAPSGEGGFDLRAFARMLRRMPMILLMTFVTFLGIGLIMAYVKLFAMSALHVSEVEFGTLLLLPALIIAALSIPLGTLGDRIGKARAVKLGIGVCAASFWLLILFFNEITLVLFGSLIGLGFVIAFPAWMALVSEITDADQRGAAIGSVGTAQGAGAILGVAVSGVLYRLPGIDIGPLNIPNHGIPFLGCAIMLLVAFLLAITSVHESMASRS